jgi:glycosyltransferase involved in cell wall biosynthesis
VEKSENPEVDAIRNSGLFDASFYLAMNPDIQPVPADPVLHYCEYGWREGRNPSSEFDTRGYLEAYSDIRNAKINPFWHYVTAGRSEARQATPGHTVKFEDDIQFGDLNCDLTLIAYYSSDKSKQGQENCNSIYMNVLSPLPSISRSTSDESDSINLSDDVALARRHGISAFCFNYSLDGDPEPSSPLSVFITEPEISFKFIIDVDLRSMKFDEQRIQLLRLALTDGRNLRIDGRPVLVLTLPEDAAQCAAAISAISAMLSREHKLFRIARRDATLAYGASSSQIASLEAELDFPVDPVPGETGSFRPIDRLGLNCVPYGVAVSQAIARMKAGGEKASPQYRAITVGRDETPYKPVSSLIYSDYRNDEYRRWLEAAISDVKKRFETGRRLLFLNAWNDWKQGAVLEPNRQTGFSKLNETTRTLLGVPPGLTYPKVSVIVPNFNHAEYLPRRLNSIYGQSYKNIEVVLLDDCSTDLSRDILTEYSERHADVTTTIYNQENSGGVFRQWAKGIEAATGDLVWIAESDDYCDENFLETLVKCFEDEAVLLAYSRTEFVSTDETVMPNEFQHHVRTLKCREKWERSYLNTAHQEVSEALGIINTIPNASGAIFRRPVDMPLLNDVEWLSMRVVGDWIFYLHLIRGGRVAYSIDTTNYFRRGDGSAVARSLKTDAFYQELGLAARTVSRLYDIPALVIDQAQERSWELYRHYSDGDWSTFSNLYKKSAALDEQSRRTPNVLVTTMGFYPGGAEILPIRLVNELKRQGHSVLLLSTGLLGNNEDGVRRLLRRDVPLVVTSDIILTKEIIREFGIEILNSHQWHVQKYPVAIGDAFVDLRGHVASLHGMIEHGNAFGVTAKQLRAANDFVSTWVYTAEKNLDPFKRYGIYQTNLSKFVKLPNGMEPPTINPVRRSDLGIPSDAFVLCCVSRAIPDKGWAETIAAVTQARETTGKDIRLILVGNGPLYDTYRKSGVPPFVYLIGFSENSVGYYAASDMGIMLTKFKSESFPLTIVDCLFAGKPFIATAVGEIPNMLATESGPAGQVINLLDWEVSVDDAARSIAKFATDPDALRSCEEVVPMAASRYKIDGLVKQYGQIFEQTKNSFKETLAQRLLRWLKRYSVYN